MTDSINVTAIAVLGEEDRLPWKIVHLYVNHVNVGYKMWAPYTFDLTHFVKEGENLIEVEVTNSLANKMSKVKLVSELLGPVQVKIGRKVYT